jgi:glycosyltransferase involved in cell wall biosynthesis
MSVTVVLNGYKRPYALEQQYDAIKNQTYKDINLILWVNLTTNNLYPSFPEKVINNCESIICNTNYGTWGRFSAALNARTKYIAVIDDDTIPGSRWIENCVETIKSHSGILTARGIIFDKSFERSYPSPQSYKPYGWCNPNQETVRVDMGCQSWFFEKHILRAFWAEAPEVNPMNYGEDTHISYVAQRFFGLHTYVPAHPIEDESLWGSIPETALKYGEDASALSWSNEANVGMNNYWNFVRNNGYKILCDEE